MKLSRSVGFMLRSVDIVALRLEMRLISRGYEGEIGLISREIGHEGSQLLGDRVRNIFGYLQYGVRKAIDVGSPTENY